MLLRKSHLLQSVKGTLLGCLSIMEIILNKMRSRPQDLRSKGEGRVMTPTLSDGLTGACREVRAAVGGPAQRQPTRKLGQGSQGQLSTEIRWRPRPEPAAVSLEWNNDRKAVQMWPGKWAGCSSLWSTHS